MDLIFFFHRESIGQTEQVNKESLFLILLYSKLLLVVCLVDNPVINRSCPLQCDPAVTPIVLGAERYKNKRVTPLPPSSATERRKGKDMHFVHTGYRNCDFCHLESFMLRQWSVNKTFYKCL